MTVQIATLIEGVLLTNTKAPYQSLYVAPTSVSARVDALSIVNTGTASATVTLNIVANAGSATAANVTTMAQAILPNQTWNSPNEVGHVLSPGDSIQAITSTASVLAVSSGGLLQF